MDDPHDRTIAEMNRRTNERNKGDTENSSTDWQKIKPCKILKLFNLGQFGLEQTKINYVLTFLHLFSELTKS